MNEQLSRVCNMFNYVPDPAKLRRTNGGSEPYESRQVSIDHKSDDLFREVELTKESLVYDPMLNQDFLIFPKGQYVYGGNFGIGPKRFAEIQSFAVASKEVSNEQFAKFVKATGYVTDCEKLGWGWVYFYDSDGQLLWEKRKGASWRNPFAKAQFSLAKHAEKPVVQVSANDARAFANWAKMRLLYSHEFQLIPDYLHNQWCAIGELIRRHSYYLLLQNLHDPQAHLMKDPSKGWMSESRDPTINDCATPRPFVAEICNNLGLARVSETRGRRIAVVRSMAALPRYHVDLSYGRADKRLFNGVNVGNSVDYMPYYQGRVDVGFRVAIDSFERFQSCNPFAVQHIEGFDFPLQSCIPTI